MRPLVIRNKNELTDVSARFLHTFCEHVDGDGNLDLGTIVWNNSEVSILKGNSDGTFVAEPIITLLPPLPGYESYGAIENAVLDLNGASYLR